MTPTRVAIVGCGWAGDRHAQAYAACGARLAWAVDVDRGRAEALAEAHGRAQVATDYHRALEDREVDAVDICLPHSLHASVAVEAAEVGKHVLCEKPMADSLDGADRMIQAAEDAGVILMIAENVRFMPVLRKVRVLLDDGAIGCPALVQITRECDLTHSFLQDRRWFLDRNEAAGGIMMSGGIHDVETMRMLIGEITSVQALRARQRFPEMEGDDTSIAMVRFQNGAVGTMVESFVIKSLTTASGSEVHSLRIDGDLGSLSVRDGCTIQLFSERDDYLPGGALAQHDVYVPPGDSFALEIGHFLRCIRTGQEPITSGRAQRRPLEVVLAAYASMVAEGRPVMLP